MVIRKKPVPASIVGMRKFTAEVAAVPLARHWMRHDLTYGPHVRDDALDDTEQCLAELVANSVAHGTQSWLKPFWPWAAFVHVTILDVGDGVRIEVIDQGSKFKKPVLAPHKPDVLEVHGRGLFIVETLSRSWSYYDDDRGRTTFCEIPY